MMFRKLFIKETNKPLQSNRGTNGKERMFVPITKVDGYLIGFCSTTTNKIVSDYSVNVGKSRIVCTWIIEIHTNDTKITNINVPNHKMQQIKDMFLKALGSGAAFKVSFVDEDFNEDLATGSEIEQVLDEIYKSLMVGV